jgi:hypothetical protein
MQPAGEDRPLLPAHDGHAAVLEGLTERLEARPGELGKLVEEEHAVMGERDLPGQGNAAPADEPGRRHGVMRCPEGPPRDHAPAIVQPRHGVDAGDADGFLVGERRKKRREPAGDHGLPGSRRTVQKQVVAAGHRRRHGRQERVVAAHVGQVELRGPVVERGGLVSRHGRRGPLAAEKLDRLDQRRDAADLDALDQSGLTGARQRNDEPPQTVAPRSLGDGERPAHGAHFSRQRKLAADRAACHRLARQLPARDEHGDGEREIEPRADLVQRRRREVDVIRLSGNSKPEFTIAARTLSRASRTALSASPTTVKAGRPERMSASTQTRRLSTPSSAKVTTRASIRRLPAGARASPGGPARRS